MRRKSGQAPCIESKEKKKTQERYTWEYHQKKGSNKSTGCSNVSYNNSNMCLKTNLLQTIETKENFIVLFVKQNMTIVEKIYKYVLHHMFSHIHNKLVAVYYLL